MEVVPMRVMTYAEDLQRIDLRVDGVLELCGIES
jgi:hypothetical protein